MAVVRKKQDDKNLKILREIVSIGGNRQCFDCGQRGPTYVNMTIGSFVCTRCSGVLRGLTPPHRVKSISMAVFTPDEIVFIRSHGNDECAKTWLGLWDPKRTKPEDHRELMIDKYERKRYYLEPASPLKSIAASQQLTPPATTTSVITSTSSASDNAAALKAITLTPPTSLRLKKNEASAAAAIANARTAKFQHQFTPDDSSLFNQTNQNRLNNNNSFNRNNGLNFSSTTLPAPPTGILKNGIKKSIDNNNKFTPDTEFVADFGAANIFNATTTTTGLSINNHHNNVNHNNNNINNNGSLKNNIVNGTTTGIKSNNSGPAMANGDFKGATENFADFEHNPIYNAAANNQTNTQWNVWQQFQWPFMPPEQNRWSLPMSLSSSNSLNSSGTFTSSSSINSTPSADRYAALKDLDEQLRENKEKDKIDTFSTQPGLSHINPFKANTSLTGNPFQQQQQQQPNPSQQTTNWSHNNSANEQTYNATSNLFSHHPANYVVGGFESQLQQMNNIQPVGFNNGYAQPVIFNGYMPTTIPQNNGGGFGNPFTTGSMNSNNPFL